VSGNASEIWIAQLTQLHQITQQVARAIARNYPTVQALYQAYSDPNLTEAQKMELLKDIKVEGRSTPVGSVVSNKLYVMLTSEDPGVLLH
jgi:hypothetical protein